MADVVGEDRVILHACAHRADLVGRQAGGARGGDRRIRDEVRPERPAEHPDEAERRHGRQCLPAVAGRDPGQSKHRQGREDEDGDAEQRRAGHEQVRLRTTDGVAQGLDADAGVAPVGNRVERPVEGLEEAHVEDLHDDQQAEQRPDDVRQEPSAVGGKHEGQGDHDEAFERHSHERAGRQTTKLVRSDEGDPHHEQGEDREQCREARAHWPARPGVASGDCAGNLPVCDLRLPTGRGAAVDPQPHDVVAERCVQQRESGEQDGLGQSERQDVGSRDGQHDALNRGDDPAPVAPRQRCAHPRQHPAGGVERVACRPDPEHPHARRTGHVHAEDCDQERVHLTVEVHAQRRRPPGVSHDPPVDRVQRERDDRERHRAP